MPPANPLSSPPPLVSCTTLPITGLLVDIYGLSELSPTAMQISCLWLHHPRSRRKEDMAYFACRAVSSYNQSGHYSSSRGLIALSFDQRNHGSRLVDDKANKAWKEGNERHAQDMFGVIAGTVSDQERLIDAVGGYLFYDDREIKREIDRHMLLGISLGGHTVWQTMFLDPRVVAGVAVIGCPDFEYLMRNRARLSKLATYSNDDGGASFAGSKDFPLALVEACKKLDPKGIVFGTSAVPAPGTTSEAEQKQLRAILDEKVKGKKFLICSGADDKLVPYRCSQPFLDWCKDAIRTWYADGNLYVEDNVYAGVGHTFSAEMVKDAIRFVVNVAGGDEKVERTSEVEDQASNI
ncbi:hypothetical protein BR93DRAFT_981961 [Coniochaeta sp. PMI_546]|nr:hypothetical protein BR93DRAFT_981961 [Coniochaeta sp. PMI_546]